MEKFTNWRDKGTGIAPFLPPSIGSPSCSSKLITGLQLFIKCIVVLPLALTYQVTKCKIILRWILIIFLGWKTDVSVQGIKKRELTEKIHYPQKDKLYLCNSSSPIDALTLHMIAQGPACFLVPYENAIFKMTWSTYMDFVLDGSLNLKKYGQEVNNIDQLKGNVLFMFPEGTASNGKSILPFQINAEALEEFLSTEYSDTQVQTIHLKVNGTLVAPLALKKNKFINRMVTKGVNVKIKINQAQPIAPINNLRIALNDGNKFKLVSRTLDIESKRQFAHEFSRP